MHLSG